MKFQKQYIYILLLVLAISWIPLVSAQSNSYSASDYKNTSNELCIHVFLDYSCNECDETKTYLDSLKLKDIHIIIHNVDNSSEKELYETFKETYGLKSAGYPSVFIGNTSLIGINSIKDNLENVVEDCKENGCPCPANEIKGLSPSIPKGDFKPEDTKNLDIPFVGEVNIAAMPITLITVLISFIDGFNPCSLWLITFLLGIVIYSNSRKKIILVGGTFLLVTGISYALFMAGLLNVFLYIGYLHWLQIIVATIAFIFAVVNIKDYFWYKKGISFTIPDKFKPKIFKNLREVMKSDKSFSGTITGTAILALGVVLIELPCTAGFPMIWSNMIAQNQIQGFAFFMLLILYMIIYLSIEIIIILVALLTMKATKFEEKQGRILKLIGGMIMLVLALVMLINPNLMNSLGYTIIIFGGAIVTALLIIFVHRKVLPKYNLIIGTEDIKSKGLEAKDEKKKKKSDKK